MRTHVVAIDPRKISQFNEDGSLATGQISLDYACRHCHGTTKSDAELLTAASGYHANPCNPTNSVSIHRKHTYPIYQPKLRTEFVRSFYFMMELLNYICQSLKMTFLTAYFYSLLYHKYRVK